MNRKIAIDLEPESDLSASDIEHRDLEQGLHISTGGYHNDLADLSRKLCSSAVCPRTTFGNDPAGDP